MGGGWRPKAFSESFPPRAMRNIYKLGLRLSTRCVRVSRPTAVDHRCSAEIEVYFLEVPGSTGCSNRLVRRGSLQGSANCQTSSKTIHGHLEQSQTDQQERFFCNCLGRRRSGVQISTPRPLTSLSSIHSYRRCYVGNTSWVQLGSVGIIRDLPSLAPYALWLARQATSSNRLRDEGAPDRSQYERASRQSTPRLPG